MTNKNKKINPNNLTSEEEEEFLNEIRRLINQATSKMKDTIQEDNRASQITAFMKDHEDRMIIDAQKECLFYLEDGRQLH